MSDEQLRKWFVDLSSMIDGGLAESSSFEDGLEWFGNLPDETLAGLQALGSGDRNIRDFLALGQELMTGVIE